MNNNNNIVIYQSEDGKVHLDVMYNEKTMWLSQQQMFDLYQTSRTNIVEHIKHIYDDGELTEAATCRKFRQVRLEGSRSVEREIQAMKRRPMYMNDYIQQLDNILSSTGEQLLSGAGKISHSRAISKAEIEYRKYEQLTLSPVEQAYLDTIKQLNKEAKNKNRK